MKSIGTRGRHGGRSRHLDEGRLFELYAESLVDPGRAADPHLAHCEECAVRFATLRRTLDEHREAEQVLADTFFTPDRLARQVHRILHRLDVRSQLARVLPFPIRAARGVLARHSSRSIVRARWLAAAAAAGLLVGVTAGRWLDLSPRSSPAARVGAASAGEVASSIQEALAEAGHDDEERFLAEIEAVLFRQPAPELYALDAFTPRSRDLLQADR